MAIMLNAPLEWNVMLHWSESPPIESVLMLAKQYEDTLKKCFTCGSDNHWVRECPHYGAYSSHLDHKTMWKEHHHYKSPQYKAAYAVMINAHEEELGFQGWSR
jgi:Zinc knuckle